MKVKSETCFGHYLDVPKCGTCKMEPACLRATLGGMAERGLLRERFDPKRGEHVYSITEIGRQSLVRRGLLKRIDWREKTDG